MTVFGGAVDATFAAFGSPGDQLSVGGGILVIQGQPERRDPDRLVWTLEARPV